MAELIKKKNTGDSNCSTRFCIELTAEEFYSLRKDLAGQKLDIFDDRHFKGSFRAIEKLHDLICLDTEHSTMVEGFTRLALELNYELTSEDLDELRYKYLRFAEDYFDDENSAMEFILKSHFNYANEPH